MADVFCQLLEDDGVLPYDKVAHTFICRRSASQPASNPPVKRMDCNPPPLFVLLLGHLEFTHFCRQTVHAVDNTNLKRKNAGDLDTCRILSATIHTELVPYTY